MNRNSGLNNEQQSIINPTQFKLFLSHLFDGFLFLAVFYVSVWAALLFHEGLFSHKQTCLYQLVCVIALLAVHGVTGRVSGRSKMAAFLWFALDIALLFAFQRLFTWFSSRPPEKGDVSSFLPTEWHRMGSVYLALIKVSPALYICYLLTGLFVIYAALHGKGKISVKSMMVFLVVVILFFFRFRGPFPERGFNVVFAPVLVGILLTFTGFIFGFQKLMVRSFLITLLCGWILLFYMGRVPVFKTGEDILRLPGAQQVYPLPGQRSQITLAYLREIYVEPEDNTLFAAFGPTSGFLKVDLEQLKNPRILNYPSVVRHMVSSSQTPYLYALDWLGADMVLVNKKRFSIAKKINLFDKLTLLAWSFQMHQNHAYVISSDLPGVTEYALPDFVKKEQISFLKHGVTLFKEGALESALDTQKNKLFVEVGMVDLKGRYAVVRLDARTLTIEEKLILPEGGLSLLWIPESRSLLVASFFSRKIYEMRGDGLKIKRILDGPWICRNMIYDPKRKLLFASGYGSGDLWVIHYPSGEKLARFWVGQKVSALFYSQAQDSLYIGSSRGILQIKLQEFLQAATIYSP